MIKSAIGWGVLAAAKASVGAVANSLAKGETHAKRQKRFYASNLAKGLAKCIWKVFGKDANLLKEQTSKNAPTIRTGKDYTVSGEELWNRSYVHELGNKLNRDVLAKGGEHHGGPTTSKSGYPDTDAGGRLEECLFGNIRP